MSKIAVVYWSGTGNTEIMAKAVVEGIKEAGKDAVLLTASEFGPNMVGEYDAIAFGCPSMGAEVLEESEFDPMFSEVENSLSGKKIALFGSYDWGDGQWMRDWEERVEKNAAILVTEGLIINNTPDTQGEGLCKELGTTLAKA